MLSRLLARLAPEKASQGSNILYFVRNNKFQWKEFRDNGICRVDGHMHSAYSGRNPDIFVKTPVTELLGVRESYTSIKKIYKTLSRKGMDFFAVMDHDNIIGALEMRRRHPGRAFVNCEYTVVVDRKKGQSIHVGCWGIDYIKGRQDPLSDEKVIAFHNALLYKAKHGYMDFLALCKANGIYTSTVFNHPAWQGTPKTPLTGQQLDELTDAFHVLEVNGDHQLENLVSIDIAEAKNKLICSGSDAHYARRLGNQFTASLYPVSTPYEFIRAFRNGDIAIGSTLPFPANVEMSVVNIVNYQFNGTISSLQRDTAMGIVNYFGYDWGRRKLISTGALFGLPALLSIIFGPEWVVPLFLAINAGIFSTIPVGMPIIERFNAARRTREIYEAYNTYKADQKMRPLLAEIERISKLKAETLNALTDVGGIREAVKSLQEELNVCSALEEKVAKIRQDYNKGLPRLHPDLRRWSKFTYWLLNRSKRFHNNYDPYSALANAIEQTKDEDNKEIEWEGNDVY